MKEKRIISSGLPLLLCTALLRVNPVVAETEGSKLIRIVGEIPHEAHESPHGIRIVPEALTVSKGEVVTWFNWARNVESINVVLEEKCEDLADVEKGFNKAGPCYFTGWMTLGETSSLKFNKEGVYEYIVEVKTQDDVITHRGKVIVQ